MRMDYSGIVDKEKEKEKEKDKKGKDKKNGADADKKAKKKKGEKDKDAGRYSPGADIGKIVTLMSADMPRVAGLASNVYIIYVSLRIC